MLARAHLDGTIARLTALAALLATSTIAAQQPRWDVPERGALVYRRSIDRFEVATPTIEQRGITVRIRAEQQGSHSWRWTEAARQALPPGFERPDFDDSTWAFGESQFGDAQMGGRTRWGAAEIALRSIVDLGTTRPRALWFVISHDDDVTVWLNGTLVVDGPGHGRDHHYLVTGAALDAWRPGDNLIAVRCIDIGGAKYVDLELSTVDDLPAGDDQLEQLQQARRERDQQRNRVRAELFPPYHAPALLLHGELDDDRRALRFSPGDLRDLGAFVATDLGLLAENDKLKHSVSRLWRFGDLTLRGSVGARDPDGWQTIELDVETLDEPVPGEDSKRQVQMFVRPHLSNGFTGHLTVLRQVQIGDGDARVPQFRSTLTGQIRGGERRDEPVGELVYEDTWRLDRTQPGRDATFRAAVDQALRRGTAHLRERMTSPHTGGLAAEAPDSDRSYNTGLLALGVLALMKGGVPKDDMVVEMCLAELRRRTVIDTYSLGLALMAIETYYAPEDEFAALEQGTIDRPRPRRPSAADQQLMQKWVDRLLANVDSDVDGDKLLRFHYVGEAGYDNSVTQYGLLGLYSAHLCGIDIRPSVWEAAAAHLMRAQIGKGPKVDLKLTDYRAVAADETGRTNRAINAQANGWAYNEPRVEGERVLAWGSMVCAGLTGLAICEAALLDRSNGRGTRLTGEIATARNNGFAWLARNMTVRYHPGAIERRAMWTYYYLYGLERAALLNGVSWIQGRDWYFDGAMVLIESQLTDGAWPADAAGYDEIAFDAMAILFLKRGTLPVLTGR